MVDDLLTRREPALAGGLGRVVGGAQRGKDTIEPRIVLGCGRRDRERHRQADGEQEDYKPADHAGIMGGGPPLANEGAAVRTVTRVAPWYRKPAKLLYTVGSSGGFGSL